MTITQPPSLFLATGNAHKMGEIQEILHELLFNWSSTKEFPGVEEPVENGTTYEENAIIKARFWAAKTGRWTLSDDSGLEVDALSGRPGIYSARYGSGADPIEKLLGELSVFSIEEQRTARFVCTVCLCSPAGEVDCATGILEGKIAKRRAGSGGFGYDPIFIPEGKNGLHLSQVSAEEKNQISHRGRALQQLLPVLRARLF